MEIAYIKQEAEVARISTKSELLSVANHISDVLKRFSQRNEISVEVYDGIKTYRGSLQDFSSSWSPSDEIKNSFIHASLYLKKRNRYEDIHVLVAYPSIGKLHISVSSNKHKVLSETILMELHEKLKSLNDKEDILPPTERTIPKIMLHTPEDEKEAENKKSLRHLWVNSIITVVASIIGAAVGAVITYFLMK